MDQVSSVNIQMLETGSLPQSTNSNIITAILRPMSSGDMTMVTNSNCANSIIVTASPSVSQTSQVHQLQMLHQQSTVDSDSQQQSQQQQQHFVKPGSIVKRLYPCDFCVTWYASEKDLQMHIVQKHTQDLMRVNSEMPQASTAKSCFLSFQSQSPMDDNTHTTLYQKTTNGERIKSEADTEANSTIYLNVTKEPIKSDSEQTTISAGAKRLAEKRDRKRREMGEADFREWMAAAQRRTRAKRRAKLGEEIYKQEMALKQRKTRERRKLRQSIIDQINMGVTGDGETISSNLASLSLPLSLGESGGSTTSSADLSSLLISPAAREKRLSRAVLRERIGEEEYKKVMADRQRISRAKKKGAEVAIESDTQPALSPCSSTTGLSPSALKQRKSREQRRAKIGEEAYRREMAEQQRRTRERKKLRESQVQQLLTGQKVAICILDGGNIACANYQGQSPPDFVPLSDLSPSLVAQCPDLNLNLFKSERALILQRAGLVDNFEATDHLCNWHRYSLGLGFQVTDRCCHPVPFHLKFDGQPSQDTGTGTSLRICDETISLYIGRKYGTPFPIGQTICISCWTHEMQAMQTTSRSSAATHVQLASGTAPGTIILLPASQLHSSGHQLLINTSTFNAANASGILVNSASNTFSPLRNSTYPQPTPNMITVTDNNDSFVVIGPLEAASTSNFVTELRQSNLLNITPSSLPVEVVSQASLPSLPSTTVVYSSAPAPEFRYSFTGPTSGQSYIQLPQTTSYLSSATQPMNRLLQVGQMLMESECHLYDNPPSSQWEPQNVELDTELVYATATSDTSAKLNAGMGRSKEEYCDTGDQHATDEISLQMQVHGQECDSYTSRVMDVHRQENEPYSSISMEVSGQDAEQYRRIDESPSQRISNQSPIEDASSNGMNEDQVDNNVSQLMCVQGASMQINRSQITLMVNHVKNDVDIDATPRIFHDQMSKESTCDRGFPTPPPEYTSQMQPSSADAFVQPRVTVAQLFEYQPNQQLEPFNQQTETRESRDRWSEENSNQDQIHGDHDTNEFSTSEENIYSLRISNSNDQTSLPDNLDVEGS